jgi:hypothetical protein
VISDELAAFRVHPAAKTATQERMWEEIWSLRAEELKRHPLSRVAHRVAWKLRAYGRQLGVGRGVGHVYVRPESS